MTIDVEPGRVGPRIIETEETGRLELSVPLLPQANLLSPASRPVPLAGCRRSDGYRYPRGGGPWHRHGPVYRRRVRARHGARRRGCRGSWRWLRRCRVLAGRGAAWAVTAALGGTPAASHPVGGIERAQTRDRHRRGDRGTRSAARRGCRP